ncbi:hypothetical protein CH256_11570 [Rhodococcus sp. 05-2254-6]|nr:hypothetical protein CH256_11570 [Rhodococcus sp. 05-2254-6]
MRESRIDVLGGGQTDVGNDSSGRGIVDLVPITATVDRASVDPTTRNVRHACDSTVEPTDSLCFEPFDN